MAQSFIRFPHRWSERPKWPYDINWQSWEAYGLKTWIPLGSAPTADLVGGGGLSSGDIRPASVTAFGEGNGYTRQGAGINAPAIVPNLIPVNIAVGRPITISFWLWRMVNTTCTLFITTGNNPIRINVQTTTTMRFQRIPGGGGIKFSTCNLSTQQLYHVICTDDDSALTSSTMQIYLNGLPSKVSGTDATGGVTRDTPDFVIGSLADGSAQLMGGMADFRIYNYQMNDRQALDLYTRAARWDLYRTPPIYFFMGSSSFLSRLAVLGAG